MKRSPRLAIVLVTAPDTKTARKLARAALQQKLIACANLIPGLESHYWWQGKIESAHEILILFKTTRRNLPALEKFILREHPYDTPEFIALTPSAATPRYLKWWLASTHSRRLSH
jgi:periplasmic divalent cation tolerance protein